MADGRGSPGKIRPTLPARVWNGMVDAGLAHAAKSKAPPVPPEPDLNKAIIKNATGASLSAGSVVEIGNALVTNPTRYSPWFSGDEPDPDGTREIAITLSPLRPNALGEAQVSGGCFAIVNITHTSHRYADVDVGDTVLKSHLHGRARIAWKKTGSTGEQLCYVILGTMYNGPFKGTASSGGIAAGGSATVTTSTSSETVHFNHMDTGDDIADETEIIFHWFANEQKYVVTNADCP